MRDRLLIRHFLWRFLEHDLISPNTDRRDVLSAAAGALTAFSLFLAVLVAWPYQLAIDLPPGMTSLRFFDDRFLFVSLSMLMMALAAVTQWDALVLDARDTAILGPLPLSRSTIVRAKFAATALFALGVGIVWNACPTLLRLGAIPMSLPIGVPGAIWLTLAHAVATAAAGAFGFLTVLAIRETSFAILGADRFRRVSALLQAVLLVGVITGLILVPGQSSNVAKRWLKDAPASGVMLPPLWFVGLHEAIAGQVVDDVPRVEGPSYLHGREQEATQIYRSLWPLYRRLAGIAGLSLLFVAATAMISCLWNSRRLPAPSPHVLHRDSRMRRGLAWAVDRVIAPAPLERAGFFFALQTLSRRVSHRVPLAAAMAIAVSVLVIATGGGGSDRAMLSVPVLAAQSIVVAAVLTGFRHATLVPSELRASTTFCLAWPGRSREYVAGVKRAGWLVLVIPTLVIVAVWHAAIFDSRLALLHFGIGLSVAGVLLEILFLRDRRVPLVSAYAPGVDAKAHRIAYGMAVLFASVLIAAIERAALDSLTLYAIVVTMLMAIAAGLRVSERLFPVLASIDLDEPPSMPTQRLDLA